MHCKNISQYLLSCFQIQISKHLWIKIRLFEDANVKWSLKIEQNVVSLFLKYGEISASELWKPPLNYVDFSDLISRYLFLFFSHELTSFWSISQKTRLHILCHFVSPVIVSCWNLEAEAIQATFFG